MHHRLKIKLHAFSEKLDEILLNLLMLTIARAIVKLYLDDSLVGMQRRRLSGQLPKGGDF